MQRILGIGFCLLLGFGPQILLAKEPPREVLGFNLHMTEAEVRARLKEIGTFVRAEKHDEAWKIKDDPSFSDVIVGFGKGGQLRYITAVAREDKDAKRVAYGEVGKMKEARQAGDVKIKNFNYQWQLPVRGGDPEVSVIAMGRDPKYLSTLSLKRLGRQERDDD
ncbi:MAG: hypothetical protein ACR2NX_10435 [Chthoniobacterales bacterium]